MNRYFNTIKYILGLLAIVTGAFATFDNTLIPVVRYLIIYGSILVVMLVLLHSIYSDVDDETTIERIRDEQ